MMHARTVETGYDALAPTFLEWTQEIEGDPTERFLAEVVTRLPAGARVLDLGCGPGRVTRRLERFEVVGVDLSEEQLRRARANAPTATFLQGDFTQRDFPERSFDAVLALFSIVHVPRNEHAALLGRIARWLAPGGLFLASLSHRGGPDSTDEWLGVPMFFSGFDAETNRRLVREAGLELLVDELVFHREPDPDGEVGFLWVLARA
ncbi:MAG: class I SAM-dependent methyltransferase [Thermoleophilia bacterium]|nr:class I SAM-dependent methyltransferase [Thermoleophilia bacterium]